MASLRIRWRYWRDVERVDWLVALVMTVGGELVHGPLK